MPSWLLLLLGWAAASTTSFCQLTLISVESCRRYALEAQVLASENLVAGFGRWYTPSSTAAAPAEHGPAELALARLLSTFCNVCTGKVRKQYNKSSLGLLYYSADPVKRYRLEPADDNWTGHVAMAAAFEAQLRIVLPLLSRNVCESTFKIFDGLVGLLREERGHLPSSVKLYRMLNESYHVSDSGLVSYMLKAYTNVFNRLYSLDAFDMARNYLQTQQSAENILVELWFLYSSNSSSPILQFDIAMLLVQLTRKMVPIYSRVALESFLLAHGRLFGPSLSRHQLAQFSFFTLSIN